MNPLHRFLCPILAATAVGAVVVPSARAFGSQVDKYAPGATDAAERAARARGAVASVPASVPVTAPARALDANVAYPLQDVAEDGTLWVRGRRYKASFGVDGAAFVPAFAPDAPRNFPVRFEARRVAVGGESVDLAQGVPAQRDGDVVSIDHGACTEQYVITADAIEQRFVFATLPTRGELTVSIDVATELVARPADGGFVFGNEYGSVRYGSAVAVDARGARVDVAAHLADGRLDLTVPAGFVSTAVLPLVIDPLTSTIAVDTDTDSDWKADVAYDPTTNAFLVVYEEQFSATDHDVYARKYVDQVLSGFVTIDGTTTDWRSPRIANNALSTKFLCVAEVGVSPNRIVRGREFLATTLATGTQFTISTATDTGDNRAPDVGGDPALVGPTYWCVVWERERTDGDLDVLMRLAIPGGGLLGSGTYPLLSIAGLDDRDPAISKTNGLPPFATQDWNVVWERLDGTGGSDIAGARVHWNGTITSTPFWVAQTSGTSESNPVASECLNDTPAGRPWIAAYDVGTSLRFDAFDDWTKVGTTDLAGSTFFNPGSPAITTDGSKFPFAYVVSGGLFPSIDTDVRAGTLNWVAGQFSYAEVPIDVAASSTVDETRPSIVGTHTSFVTNPWRCYVAYDTNGGADYDVLAGVYDVPINAGGFIYCDGTVAACPCSNGNDGSLGLSGCANSAHASGAQLTSTGQWGVTSDTMRLFATGMPATSPCLFFQGVTISVNGNPFGDGLRCAGGSIVRLAIRTASGGAATYGYPTDTPIHLQGLIPAAGGWRYYQTWYRDSAAFCSTSTFNLTNGLAALWTP